ncbi:alkyl hydroperoxide reductase [Gammaproteobacteria bacterium SCGC AG-212-F23]|nr:alkyl hydroperoxide reductase [Gammaproteobacteria bacterium SCGC AG-212-F23]
MVETASTMLPLGTIAPDFNLLDTCNKTMVSLRDHSTAFATVILFICNHCPYVKLIQKKLVEVSQYYQQKNIRFIAINSNDVEKYPADSPEKMQETAKEYHYSFPYLYDNTQEVAKAYHAACTPDFFVFDKALQCVYRGRFDEATPGNRKEVTGKDLCHALDHILAGKEVNQEQFPSVGCNIKWKK